MLVHDMNKRVGDIRNEIVAVLRKHGVSFQYDQRPLVEDVEEFVVYVLHDIKPSFER